MRSSLFLASSLLFFVSCTSRAGTGALVGAGVGATGGVVISGSGSGALIGGAVGAATGAIVGAALDESDRNSLERESPRTLRKIDNREQLSIEDIKKMSRAGLSNQVIISQIDATQSVFYLSTADLIYLKKSGISQEVIDHMIRSGKNR